jgi:2-C-methyl-D-erythritol 4-phosphate cytidylyltransferase
VDDQARNFGAGPDTARHGAPAPGRQERVGVVVVAAGMSSRMQGVNKTFAPLLGQPLISWTLYCFDSSSLVDEIVLVLSQADLECGKAVVRTNGFSKVSGICAGGDRRQDSVGRGLESLQPCDWVMVHDGARPHVTHDLLERGWRAGQETGAASAGVPVKDTIKVIGPGNLVTATPPRDNLWLAQTPQVFRYSLLMDAHRNWAEDVTDDAAMLENLGHPVQMFLGDYRNLKVTTPEDLDIMEALLRASGATSLG